MEGRMRTVDPWLPFHVPKHRRRVRLFCFHHAGGGASAYRRWANDLPDHVEVWPVQLPGRERRIAEPPFVRMSDLVTSVVGALRPYLDEPFAFFGHSMGSHVAFEVIRQIRRELRREPVHLFVAGHQAPQLRCKLGPVHAGPREGLLERIHLLAGTPEEVLLQKEMMDLMLPIIRADLELIETYEYAPAERFRCPISGLWAEQDIVADERDTAAWAEQTSGTFRRHAFQGDHFFVHSRREEVQRAILEDLSHTLAEL